MYIYNYDNLKQIINTEHGQEYYKKMEEIYFSEYANNPIPVLNYSFAKLYYIDGDRSKFQAMYFSRRRRLMVLQILALGNDKYLEPLEEILSAICDEFTWVVPAHNFVKKDNTFDYSALDLFASETGFYLAETCYVFKDKLSLDIRNRIYFSVEEKIIKKYEARTFDWETRKTNWSAVCACGVGLAYLYLFPDRFENVKDRLFHSFNCYLSGLDASGYISEGYYYWMYGFGFFTLFFDVYSQLFNENLEILKSDVIKKTLKFAQNSVLSEDVVLPFADGGSVGEHTVTGVLCNIERFYGVDLYLNKKLFEPGTKVLGFRVLVCLDKQDEQKELKKETIYYGENQVFIRQNLNYVLAAKGGNNNEIHNHNDVGCFSLVKNNKQIIADVGVGKYTRDFFDDFNVRYGEEIFVCSSLAHSVPIVDGLVQSWGVEYGAKVLEQNEKCFSIDISGAYKTENQKIVVSYYTEENFVKVKYNCAEIKEKVVFRFVSFIKPKVTTENVVINDVSISNNLNVEAVINEKIYANASAKDTLVYTIDYIVEKQGDISIEFYFNV